MNGYEYILSKQTAWATNFGINLTGSKGKRGRTAYTCKRHILGLKRQFGRAGFRLLYLWYDVFGVQGKRHRDEVLKFTEVTKTDGIKFHSLTYQELIVNLANKLRTEHPDYIRYIIERYL